MNKSLNINAAVMLCTGLVIAYATVSIMSPADSSSGAYGAGFIIGRAVASVLLSLALVYLPLAVIRKGKKKFTKGPIIAWWVLFFLLSVMSLIGSTLPAN